MPKIPTSKQKKFYYRRAAWKTEGKKTLESLLIEAHEENETVGKRTFKSSSGGELRGANFDIKKDCGIFLHIASYVPDQPTSTITKNPKLKKSKIDAELAPDGKDYLGGDIFVLVKNNHVILCPSGVRENIAESYITNILKKHFKKSISENLSFETVAKVSKVKMIQEEGVKEIILGASLYDASLQELNEKKPNIGDLRKYVADQIEKIFAQDPELKEIKEKENLNIQISIKFDGKEARKHTKEIGFGDSGKARLSSASKNLVKSAEEDGENEGFVIITGANNKISAEDILVSDTFRVKTLGKSIGHRDAWSKLENYAKQLEQSGVFSQ